MPSTAEKRATFRRLHDDGFFILPNAWDVGSAMRLGALGFPAVATTSAGAAWAAGREDGQLGLHAVLEHLRQLAAAIDLPVNADFENGFADAPDEVAANVREAALTGVAGVSIEDWSGTALYDRDLAIERIAAARAAIDAVDAQIMLIGRSEHFRVPSMSISECIGRAAAYADAGADCVFVPMIADPAALAELIAAVTPKPVSVLLPSLDADPRTLAKLGVRRCSTGALLAATSWAAFDDAAQALGRSAAEAS